MGMFLWVRLVMATLEASYTISDLLGATEILPDGLERVCVFHAPKSTRTTLTTAGTAMF
jgi:hypothetical protein